MWLLFWFWSDCVLLAFISWGRNISYLRKVIKKLLLFSLSVFIQCMWHNMMLSYESFCEPEKVWTHSLTFWDRIHTVSHQNIHLSNHFAVFLNFTTQLTMSFSFYNIDLVLTMNYFQVENFKFFCLDAFFVPEGKRFSKWAIEDHSRYQDVRLEQLRPSLSLILWGQ